MLRLARNRQEIVNAAIAYGEAIEKAHVGGAFPNDVRTSLINTLSLTQNFVTFERDFLVVAPFKWSAWVQEDGSPPTPALYHQFRTYIGGTSASRIIGEIFFDGDWPSPMGPAHARQEINRIAQRNGKELRAVCNIYDLPGESLDRKVMYRVEHLAEIVLNAKLPPEAIEALIGRIAA